MNTKGQSLVVTPQYANGTKFPFSVGLPLWVCQAARSGRQIVIAGRDQQIPLVIAEWMADDHRYCDKFVEGQSFTVEQTTEETTVSGDDLTAIKGVGPAVASKLREAGIITFKQLANGDTVYLVKLLGKPMTDTKVDDIKAKALELLDD